MDPIVNSSSSTDALEDQLAMAKKGSLVPAVWQQDQVRSIKLSECAAAGLSISYAFASDDVSKYLIDGDDIDCQSDERRWKSHVSLMTVTVVAHCLKGNVATIGPEYDSVAIWLPPGNVADGILNSLRSGSWKLHYKFSAEVRKRYYKELLPLLHNSKMDVMGDRECYYLLYLGTKPDSRGRGYATKLLEDVFKQADAEKHAIYLESSSEANNVYYTKLGFTVRKDVYFGRGRNKVRLSIMVREPCPATNS